VNPTGIIRSASMLCALSVCGERPTFKYSRIEITSRVVRLAASESLDAIVAGYRGRIVGA
jgi:hypothetical protein